MNKFTLVVLSILGGINFAFTIFSPIILVVLWISIAGINSFSSYFIFLIGLFSTMFRAIKIFLKEDKE